VKVHELIQRLQRCNPNSEVYVEANRVPNARTVQEYSTPNGTFVYIADELTYINKVLVDATPLPNPLIVKPTETQIRQRELLKEFNKRRNER